MEVKDTNNNKDKWDKLTSLTPVFATTLIGLLGLYFTNTYEAANQARNSSLDEQARIAAMHDTKIRELEAVEKLLPHLSSATATRDGQKLALIAIRELGSTKIAIQFAEILGTDGARDALEFTANTAESAEDASSARAALNRLDSLAVGISTGKESVNNWQEVVERIRQPDPDNEDFLVLPNPNGDGFLQTAIHSDPGDLYVEYSENGTLWNCKMSRDHTVKAFTLYAEGKDGWKALCEWSDSDW
jgi:hypothetical protein